MEKTWVFTENVIEMYALFARNPLCTKIEDSKDFETCLLYMKNVLTILDSEINHNKRMQNKSSMEDENTCSCSIEFLDNFSVQLWKLMLTFYKKVKLYVKENKFSCTHINLMKEVLNQIYSLKANSLLYQTGMYPKLLNLVFLISLSLTEHADFSPSAMLYFLESRENIAFAHDLSSEEIEAKESLE